MLSEQWELRPLDDSHRESIIELVHQFYRMVNELPLDGVFRIKNGAAKKFTDLYLKLLGTGKVFLYGVVEKESGKLVSVMIGREEEKPYLEEERILFIDLAVTKQGKERQGFTTELYRQAEVWCKEKGIPAIELRAIQENQKAIEYWKHLGMVPFYTRYRKLV